MTERLNYKQLKSVVGQFDTVPTPSADWAGKAIQYMGATTSSYEHGYIYECKAIPADTLVFSPDTVSCSWTDLSAFLQTETADYNSVVAGTMTYVENAELWRLVFKDANGDTVLTYQQYTADWEDVGFTFNDIFHDGDIVSFTRYTNSTQIWERIDVQPNHNEDITELQADVAEIQSVIPTEASASNQLADKNYVQVGLDGKQDTLSATDGINLSNNVISGKPLQDDIADINALIPGQASTSNQLADKNFVNSSIATNTANFIGTFNSVAELEAYSGTLTNNDYAFVIKTDSAGNTYYDRYKYTTATTPASWVFEYELNNSSFTASQWAAINSGATSSNVAQIDTNKTNIANHIANTNNPHSVTKAQVGLGNVDNTSDLDKPISTATQTALNGKQATISDLTTIRSGAALGATAVQPGDLATVATSGSYNDLSNKPTVGNGTITITQGGVSKGTFTTNQSGDTTIEIDAGAGNPVWGSIGGTLSNQTDLQNALDSKANSADVYTKAEVDTAVNAKSTCILRRW